MPWTATAPLLAACCVFLGCEEPAKKPNGDEDSKDRGKIDQVKTSGEFAKFFADLDRALPKLDESGTEVDVAAFLAAKEPPTIAILQIREEFVTDVNPPGAGARYLHAALDEGAGRWRTAEVHKFGDRAPEARSGETDAAKILDACRSLHGAGWLALPADLKDDREDLLSGSRFVVLIRLSNARRHASFERALPFGSHAKPEYDGAAEACRSILARWQ